MFEWRPDRARWTGGRLSLPDLRIQLIELPHLTIGSPTEVAVPGILQICMRDLLETTCRIEVRGAFVGDRLIVDKAVFVRRPDGLFVKVLGLELAALDACYLRAYQRGAVFEILRAILRPYFELSVVCGQSLDMLLSLVGRCRIVGRGPGKCAVKFVFRRFKK